MIIMKFGGTSVSSTKNILTICSLVRQNLAQKPVLVVSALSGVTQLLLDSRESSQTQTQKNLAEIKKIHLKQVKELFLDKSTQDQILTYIEEQLTQASHLLSKKTISKEESDKLVSFGEIMSSHLISQALVKNGIPSEQVLATKLIVTDNHFGSAEFLPKLTVEKTKWFLGPILKNNVVPVITGFIGATTTGKTTTLGRGGSDYSASIIAYSLKAKEVQIWTDVDGVFSADPRIVKNPRLLSQITFKEASELAYFGAKVLHPRTIRPAVHANIPVRVLNTFSPNKGGTLINSDHNPKTGLTAMSSKKRVTLVNISSAEMLLQKGYLVKVFDIFAQENISIDLVSVSEVSVSVTLDNTEGLESALKKLREFSHVTSSSNFGTVSLIGEGIVSNPSLIEQIFALLRKKKITLKMVSLGSSDINISLVLDSKNVEEAVKILHNKLLLAGGK